MATFLGNLFNKTDPIENAKEAINNGDFTILNEALENASDNYVAQLLDNAVKKPNKNTEETIDILASKIDDPEKQDQIINAALEKAFKTENPEIIKALLSNLKEPTTESLNNLLKEALKVGNPEIIKKLLDKGAEVSEQNMDTLIGIVKSAPNKNSNSFKDIVKLLTETLTKNTTKLLEELRPTKQNELNEKLKKNLEQLKVLEETKPSQDIQAIEDLMKAVKSINEDKLDAASHHLEQASNSTGNPDLKKIAGELKDNVKDMNSIKEGKAVGPFTEKVNSEQKSPGENIQIG